MNDISNGSTVMALKIYTTHQQRLMNTSSHRGW